MTVSQTLELANRLLSIYCPGAKAYVNDSDRSSQYAVWRSDALDKSTVKLLIGSKDGDFAYQIDGIRERLRPDLSEFPLVLYAILHEIGHVVTLTSELDDLDRVPIDGQTYGNSDNATHRKFPSEKAADDWMIETINSNYSGLLAMCWEVSHG